MLNDSLRVCATLPEVLESVCRNRWAAGKAGFSLSMTFIQALVYGSLISTTDTVRSSPGPKVLPTLSHTLRVAYSLSGSHCQILIQLLHARVQVTIVAVLQRLGANEDLYALVFGESCLNDAVGVVLYRTLTLFLHERVTVGSTFAGILSFMGVFLGSMLIGAS